MVVWLILLGVLCIIAGLLLLRYDGGRKLAPDVADFESGGAWFFYLGFVFIAAGVLISL